MDGLDLRSQVFIVNFPLQLRASAMWWGSLICIENQKPRVVIDIQRSCELDLRLCSDIEVEVSVVLPISIWGVESVRWRATDAA